MLTKLYLAFGAAVLVAFAASSFFGWEFRPADQGVPTPGAAAVASGWFRPSSGGRSVWYSSSSRSGVSVFGGK